MRMMLVLLGAMAFSASLYAHCGACGAGAKKEAKKTTEAKKCCGSAACKKKAGMAALKLTAEQKVKVAAAQAAFQKKMAEILTPEQLKTMKASCPMMKDCKGTKAGCPKAKSTGCCPVK